MRRVFACLRFLFGEVPSKLDQAAMADNDGSNLVEAGAARDLFRRGRHKIYATTSTEVERNIRQQLQSLLGAYGFNHEIDIQAITVNRIPNGYADWYIGLDDPEWCAAIQTIRKSACRSAQ